MSNSRPDFDWEDVEKIEDVDQRMEKAVELSKYELDIEIKQMRNRIHQEQILLFAGTGYTPPYPFKD